MRAITIKQPWADLIMAGVKDVENRTWPVPSTVGSWTRCVGCGERRRRMPSGGISLHRHDGQFVDVENDGPFPFRLWIHAAKVSDPHRDIEAWKALGRAWDVGPIGTQYHVHLRSGVLLGSVIVTGCHHADDCSQHRGKFSAVNQHAFRQLVDLCSRWAQPDAWHWTLADPEPLPVPIPARGRRGLWTLPDDVAVQA